MWWHSQFAKVPLNSTLIAASSRRIVQAWPFQQASKEMGLADLNRVPTMGSEENLGVPAELQGVAATEEMAKRGGEANFGCECESWANRNAVELEGEGA